MHLMFDFTDAQTTQTWRALDDRVMGGVSQSRLRHDPAGHAVFEGVVSLAHGGGFASVRSSVGAWGRAGAQACWLELCHLQPAAPEPGRSEPAAGDTQRRCFTLSLFTDAATDSLSYQARWQAPMGSHWQRLALQPGAFRARYRGRDVPGAPPLDPAGVRQVGLLIGQGQAGPFALGLRRIGWD